MPSDEKARKIADDMFFGPHKPECDIPEDQTMTVRYGHAVRVISAALAAAEAGEPVASWECFRDEAFFDMWCVRPKGERRFGHSFHVTTEEEAEGLVALLSASPPSEASREERETASPGPWPTEAEYELWQNDEFAAGASGSPEDAAREITHYATVYGQDGPVKIYEVKRYEVSPDALATAIRARGET